MPWKDPEKAKAKRQSPEYKAKAKAWRDAYKVKNGKAYSHVWRDAHKERVLLRDSRQKAKDAGYQPINLTEEELKIFVSKAPLVCQICSKTLKKGDSHLDHCHKTGLFRGRLCIRCNRVVGYFDKEPDLLGKIQEYMLNPPGRSFID